MKRIGIVFIAAMMVFMGFGAACGAVLENSGLKAVVTAKGLEVLEDKGTGLSLRFADDTFSVSTDSGSYSSKGMEPKVLTESGKVRLSYSDGGVTVDVVYELQPGWRFLSKRVEIYERKEKGRIKTMTVFSGKMENVPVNTLLLRGGRFGAIVRFDVEGKKLSPAASAFFMVQNPYMKWSFDDNKVSMGYVPEMDWKYSDGPFISDRALIGLSELTGQTINSQRIREWEYKADPAAALDAKPQMDIAELDALTDCVEAFLLYRPQKSVRLHVGWCENDYQIDAGTEEGRTEYKRIIDQAAAVGCQHILYAPCNSLNSSFAENRDAWNWENLLWLGMGQKIRKDEWTPGKDEVPADIQGMLDYAKSKDIGLVAYVYPTLPFMQDPIWTKWVFDMGQKPKGYLAADTGYRSFQDWLVGKLDDFYDATGATGYSFDHWWIAYEPDKNTTSQYAQWAGCRRILENLRKARPDAVLDGRQQYHNFGPWTWLAGSFPHPYASDEQPASVRAFPDLHFGRVSADRQRSAAWWYRVENFCPAEILPGFMTHQTMRSDAKGKMRRDRFKTRDWDYLGWKYSVISSIASAPYNHVVNYIPARDMDEFKAFSAADKAWFNKWLDWTDEEMDVLREHRPIMGQPMVGKVDGWAAFKGGDGFVFLFNPNYRQMDAEFKLGVEVGLKKKGRYLMRVMYPDAEKGMYVGHPTKGYWEYGDDVSIAMEGTQAKVLEVVEFDGKVDKPMLFGAVGKVAPKWGSIAVTDCKGKVGSSSDIVVMLKKDKRVKKLTVNGKKTKFKQDGNKLLATVKFAGVEMDRTPQIGVYDAKFTGGVYKAKFSVPERVFAQLKQRKKDWPIPYTEDDLRATWIGSDRLLLYVQIADPKEDMVSTLKIDGKEVELTKAYSSTYRSNPKHTYLGEYVDVSSLEPGKEYSIEVTLPELEAGRFQGLFLENIESEYTDEIAKK